jgi:hypothetical protein
MRMDCYPPTGIRFYDLGYSTRPRRYQKFAQVRAFLAALGLLLAVVTATAVIELFAVVAR